MKKSLGLEKRGPEVGEGAGSEWAPQKPKLGRSGRPVVQGLHTSFPGKRRLKSLWKLMRPQTPVCCCSVLLDSLFHWVLRLGRLSGSPSSGELTMEAWSQAAMTNCCYAAASEGAHVERMSSPGSSAWPEVQGHPERSQPAARFDLDPCAPPASVKARSPAGSRPAPPSGGRGIPDDPGRVLWRSSPAAQADFSSVALSSSPRREIMVPDELWTALSGASGAALVCCFVAAAVALRWSGRRSARGAAARARQRQRAGLENMDKAAQRFRLQNPDLDSEALLALPLPQLVQKLHSGELSPEAALFTYLGKAWEVNKGINCVTAYLADCETQLSQAPRRGLLYGVPVSLKECFSYKGQDSTLGLSLNEGVPAECDCVVVQVLKLQGAVPFVHTNIPQSMFSYDCSNPLFGKTLNPWKSSKSSGGSSGGEGALIGSGGSPLGLGTDIGGSIRFPSAFCGICGLKPTGNRLSKSGLKGCVYGQVAVQLSVGPMARDVESLALCLRALLCEDMFRLDPTVPPLPFREEVYTSSRPLRVGYYETDNYTMPSPAMKRALLETKQSLEAAGHTLVPFLPSNIPYALETLSTGGLFSDGGHSFLQNFKGDFVDPCLGDLILVLKLPSWLKGLLAFLLKPLLPRLAAFLSSMRPRSAGKLWELQHKIEVYRNSVIAQWKTLDLDVLLTPMLGPALNLNAPGRATGAVSYTVLYNCLDFPAGVVPVTTVTAEDEAQMEHYKGYFGDIWDKVLKKAMKNSVGLPVAVQCVALPWQEEMCLRFMREVERLMTPEKRPS